MDLNKITGETTNCEKKRDTGGKGWQSTFLLRPYFLLDAVLLAFALLAAYALRFNFAVPEHHLALMPYVFASVVGAEIVLLMVFGCYRSLWRYFSSDDLPRVVWPVAVASVVFLGCRVLFASESLRFYPPISVNLMNMVFAVALLTGARLLWRKGAELQSGAGALRRRAVIVGADSAGLGVLYALRHDKNVAYECVGFLDISGKVAGSIIQGIPVLGQADSAYEILSKVKVDDVIVSPGILSRDGMQTLFADVTRLGARLLVAPGYLTTFERYGARGGIRDADITDILRRNEVAIGDLERHKSYLAGKCVMVTGAGGSIGSEIVRQVMRAGARSVVMVERSEYALFEILSEVRELPFDGVLRDYIADVADVGRMTHIVKTELPEIVFHAAAYKHVPLMETHVCEAVKNNVIGTKRLAGICRAAGVSSFVLLSSDKAVDPSSVMGATKRLCEMIVGGMNGGATSFSAVRFGNVLGSTGSVVPIFSRQIKAGGPVTVTHPDMERFFMTVPEAVSLTIVAASIGQYERGRVFILDMGEPVKIVALAEEMIRLAGRVPGVDVPITFVGVRPGEKLKEILLSGDEKALPTEHSEIRCAHLPKSEQDSFEGLLTKLESAAEAGDNVQARALLMARP